MKTTQTRYVVVSRLTREPLSEEFYSQTKALLLAVEWEKLGGKPLAVDPVANGLNSREAALRAMLSAPLDDEPVTDEDLAAIAEGKAEYSEGKASR